MWLLIQYIIYNEASIKRNTGELVKSLSFKEKDALMEKKKKANLLVFYYKIKKLCFLQPVYH